MSYEQEIYSGFAVLLKPSSYGAEGLNSTEEEFENSELVQHIAENYPLLSVELHCDYRFMDADVIVAVRDTVFPMPDESFNVNVDNLAAMVAYENDEKVSAEGLAQLDAFIEEVQIYGEPGWFRWATIDFVLATVEE